LTSEGVKGTRFVINKKYRLKQDFADATLGKIPQGMTATFVSNIGGSCRFKLPNGRQFGISEKSALNLMEEQ
jgi:hypothetical protein